MANLHFKFGNEIYDLVKECDFLGEPMVRNFEYEFPGKGYDEIKDQFMLGNKIMVTPVVEKGQRSRDVIFSKGKWQGDYGKTIKGPKKLKIDVPLERLPWFRKISE